MSVRSVLQQLAAYMDGSLTVQQIESIIEQSHKPATKEIKSKKSKDDDDDEENDEDDDDDERPITIDRMHLVKTARIQPDVLNALLELCAACRSQQEVASLADTIDSWEQLANFILPAQLLAYLSCMCELIHLRPFDAIDRRLSLVSHRVYLQLLTIPGAKAVGVFHAPLVQSVLRLFGQLNAIVSTGGKQRLRDHEKVEVLINVLALLDDLEQLLQCVSFDDIDEIKLNVCEAVAAAIAFHHDTTYRSSCKCEIK